MDSLHTTAAKIKVGDNVWEHNIVTSIKEVRSHLTGEKFLLFNGDSQSGPSWFAKPTDSVMVTNRTK